jgi:hypothetical protein
LLARSLAPFRIPSLPPSLSLILSHSLSPSPSLSVSPTLSLSPSLFNVCISQFVYVGVRAITSTRAYARHPCWDQTRYSLDPLSAPARLATLSLILAFFRTLSVSPQRGSLTCSVSFVPHPSVCLSVCLSVGKSLRCSPPSPFYLCLSICPSMFPGTLWIRFRCQTATPPQTGATATCARFAIFVCVCVLVCVYLYGE